jgi:hypothetical protein
MEAGAGPDPWPRGLDLTPNALNLALQRRDIWRQEDASPVVDALLAQAVACS